MPLQTGARLGPYEILSALGAGGMGEVYRARDSKLNRNVAIKVLPDLFANDPERLARFKRKAQVHGAPLPRTEDGRLERGLSADDVTDCTVKVLDFGLAKVLEPVAGPGGDATASPTITSPAMTAMGVILGTAAYMSPEQAKGRQADKRSDVWAFGAVLYEMLTGRRAFGGEDLSDTLAAVLKSEPDCPRGPF